MTELGHRASTATSGRATVSGVRGHGASLPEVTSEDAFEVRRSDHLGLPLTGRIAVLAERLPYGTTMYVGLFTTMPSRLGTGGTELGLDRVPISRWVTTTQGANARRTNAQALSWGALSDAAVVVGWGVWTAETDGDLRAFDFLRNEADDPITHALAAGVAPGLAAGRIGLVL